MMNDSLGDNNQIHTYKNTKIMLHSSEIRDRSASKKNITADDLYDTHMNEEPSVLIFSFVIKITEQAENYDNVLPFYVHF